MSDTGDDDILRIMVSTDNHLGVWERDEWRGHDSFEAFEEVLQKAKEFKADMVLLGGDLFHENKPSRETLVKCLNILNRHCLGDSPIAFQVVSDPCEIVSHVDNTRSSTLNVGLPVFTIHGNHDDPAGVENLSAVDILSSIHYVNYFGKHSFEKENNGDSGRITLKPLLIVKGETKVALYGLGFLREERLARSFQLPGQVQWMRPDGDTSSWFNVFTLHQNRVQHYKSSPSSKARNIQDRFLPPWIDLVSLYQHTTTLRGVSRASPFAIFCETHWHMCSRQAGKTEASTIVWGHEHECKPLPEQSPEEDRLFSVLQPGSTVATSLSEPESKPKHCFLLEINRDQWRITQQPLRSVRPFKWRSVSLKELGAERGNHKQIEKLLTDVVEEMIEESLAEQAAEPSRDALGADRPAPRLPLVRLRVDYTGYSTIHSQRFGHMFINRVANPQDIILWSKTTERKPKAADGAKDAKAYVPEQLDNSHMEDLIAEFAGQLEILPAKELGEALKRFVEKDEKEVLRQAFEKALVDTQNDALNDMDASAAAPDGAEPGAEDGDDVMNRIHEAGRRRQAAADARFNDADSRLHEAAPSTAAGPSDDDMDVDGGDEEGAMAPPPSKRGRGASAAKPKAKTNPSPAPKGRAKAKAPTQRNTLEQFLSQPASAAKPGGRSTQRSASKAAKGKIAAAGLDSDDENPSNADEDAIEDDDVSVVSHTQATEAAGQAGWQSQARKRAAGGKPSQQSTAAKPPAKQRGRKK